MAKTVDYWAKLAPNCCYHVYNHAVGHDNLFLEAENYTFFLERFRLYFEPYVLLQAYCLMPNHFHLLIQLHDLTEDIRTAMVKEDNRKAHSFLAGEVPINVFYESQFKRFFTSYSRSFGKKYNRVGSLFRAKFKRIRIRDEAHFFDKLFYIHHNPIHHNFTACYTEWPHSSYLIYAQNLDSWLKPEGVLSQMGSTIESGRSNFLEKHEQYRINFKNNNAEFE